MNERGRKRQDFIQNLTIAVLSVTAVLLFAQTQIYNLGAGFFSEGNKGAPAPSQTNFTLTAPVRAAVTDGSFGRCGMMALTTADEAFEPLRGLLEQALGSARTCVASDGQTFLRALEGTSVYYDFLTPLPLSVLSHLVQTEGEETLSARRLILSQQRDTVVLYFSDESGGYLRCETALSSQILEEAVNHYELGNASFAFELTDNPAAQTLAPCTLLLNELPTLPELSVSIPLSDTSRLLASLGFNPNTQNRYTDASGAEVVTENGRTLRIHPDGTIVYKSGGDPVLSIAVGEEIPTRLEAATGVGALLNGLLSSTAGEASLYLESIRQVGGATALQYGYQVNGVPVHLADGQGAAQVSLTGRNVSSMTIRVRQYASAGTDSLLLPLRQSLSIAARQEGAELFIGYTDSGAGTSSAQWLAE